MNIELFFQFFSRIECDLSKPLDLETRGERDFFLQLVYIGLLHFCNFSALNYFFKSMIATVCAIIVLFLYSPLTCHISTPLSSLQASSWNCSGGDVAVEKFSIGQNSSTSGLATDSIITLQNNCTDSYFSGGGGSILFGETILSVLMLLGLVWLLNREFERAYRITFHCSRLSTKDRRQILNLKNQADWLLHNIIPKHVHESLKRYILDLIKVTLQLQHFYVICDLNYEIYYLFL